MTKIKVFLEAFYGYSCCGHGHGSEQNIEVEVDDAQLEALRQIGKEKITCEDITKAIAQGTTVLEPLHEQLEEKYYYMVEEYWLYEAYNECLDECLSEAIKKDVRDGLYTPKQSEDEEWDGRWDIECDDEEEDEDADAEDENKGCETTVDRCPLTIDEEDDDWEDDDAAQWDMDDYYAWVCEHDHAFVAERIGLNLDACRDEEVCYTIEL
jgi:hypothetical protein